MLGLGNKRGIQIYIIYSMCGFSYNLEFRFFLYIIQGGGGMGVIIKYLAS